MSKQFLQICVEPMRAQLAPFSHDSLIESLLSHDFTEIVRFCEAAHKRGIAKYDNERIRDELKKNQITLMQAGAAIDLSESGFCRRLKNGTPLSPSEKFLLKTNFPALKNLTVSEQEYQCQGLAATASALRSHVDTVINNTKQIQEISRNDFLYVFHALRNDEWRRAHKLEQQGNSVMHEFSIAVELINAEARRTSSSVPSVAATEKPITVGRLQTIENLWGAWVRTTLCAQPYIDTEVLAPCMERGT